MVFYFPTAQTHTTGGAVPEGEGAVRSALRTAEKGEAAGSLGIKIH